MDKKFVYVLCSEYKEYHQYGEYFLDIVLEDLPNISDLAEIVKGIIYLPEDKDIAVKLLSDLLDMKKVEAGPIYRFRKVEITSHTSGDWNDFRMG